MQLRPIYTEPDNCQDCYKCIRECPVKAIRMENNQASIIEDRCIYCGHCQPCTVGINIAEVNKYSDLAQMQDEAPASVRDHYLALEVRAGDCTGCGACEANCPFGVPIAQRMEETAALFGA